MLQFTHQSGIYTISAKTLVRTDVQTLWDFISLPENLLKITPPDMEFRITFRSSLDGEKMYPGQIIAYKLRPMPFFKASWVTEITQVLEKRFFIDEQRFGPYRFWHHQHILQEADGGIEMIDIVSYKLPYGFLGRWVGGRLVRKKLKGIFDYRAKRMKEIFE